MMARHSFKYINNLCKLDKIKEKKEKKTWPKVMKLNIILLLFICLDSTVRFEFKNVYSQIFIQV